MGGHIIQVPDEHPEHRPGRHLEWAVRDLELERRRHVFAHLRRGLYDERGFGLEGALTMPVEDLPKFGCCGCNGCHLISAYQYGGATTSYTKAQAETRLAAMRDWVNGVVVSAAGFETYESLWGSAIGASFIASEGIVGCPSVSGSAVVVAQTFTVAFWDGVPSHFYRSLYVSKFIHCASDLACKATYQHGILAYPDPGIGTFVSAEMVGAGRIDMIPGIVMNDSEWPEMGVDNGTFNLETLKLFYEDTADIPGDCDFTP